MFATAANLDSLRVTDHWFADGTFSSRPLLFEQLFVIHGLREDGTKSLRVPLVFCLTPNRTSSTYKKILEKLNELKAMYELCQILSKP